MVRNSLRSPQRNKRSKKRQGDSASQDQLCTAPASPSPTGSQREVDPVQFPPAITQDLAHPSAAHRLHASPRMMRISRSRLRSCIDASHASAASTMFAWTSSMVSPSVTQPCNAGIDTEYLPSASEL